MVKFILLVYLGLSALANHPHVFPLVPNPKLTPGDTCRQGEPAYSRLRYAQRVPVCDRTVDTEQRQRIYDNYGIPHGCRQNYTIDHFIPLSIGGSNRNENLWPEHKSIKQSRLHFEEWIMKQVEESIMTQQQAIQRVYQEKMNSRLNPSQATEYCQ
jgi:hypothetical protein